MKNCAAVSFLAKAPKRVSCSLIGSVVLLRLDGLHYRQRVFISFVAREGVEHFYISVKAAFGFRLWNCIVAVLHDIADSEKLLTPIFQWLRHVLQCLTLELS